MKTKITTPELSNRMNKHELYAILKQYAAMCGKEINICSYDVNRKTKKYFIDEINLYVEKYNENIDKENQEAYLQTPEGKAKMNDLLAQRQQCLNEWAEFKTDFTNKLKALFEDVDINRVTISKVGTFGFDVEYNLTENKDKYPVSFYYKTSFCDQPSEMCVETTSFGSYNPAYNIELANHFILQGQIASTPELLISIRNLYDTMNLFSRQMSIKQDKIENLIENLNK